MARRFARAAGEAGFVAVLAVPVRLRDDVIGVLTLLRVDAGPLTTEDTRLVQALADPATIGLLHEQAVQHAEDTAEQLQGALESRVVIEQAKGALATQAGITPEDAFGLLRGYPRRNGPRLAELARQVVEQTVRPAHAAALSRSSDIPAGGLVALSMRWWTVDRGSLRNSSLASRPGPGVRAPPSAEGVFSMSSPSIDPAGAARPAAAGLHDVVDRGLDALRSLHDPGEEIRSGKVESELRATASEWERQRTAGAPAGPLGELVATMRVACAHLGAHDLVEARLTLLALRDALPAPAVPPAEPGPARSRAAAASTAQKRALRQQATVEQAVGVVAAHGGTSPREALTLLRAHAARRGVALLELANDIVAGRIDASALLVGQQRSRRR